MGSAKSKPVAESARQVLAKRNAPPSISSNIGEAVSSVNTTPLKVDVKFDPKSLQTETSKEKSANNGYELDQSLIAEMSKWSTVKQTTKDTQVLDKGKPRKGIEDVASATLLRIQEEKSMDAQTLEAALNNKTSTKAVIKTPGRLTEGKLIDLYNRFRDNTDGTYTTAQAATDFELPEELVKTLLVIARSPTISEDKDNVELKIAR